MRRRSAGLSRYTLNAIICIFMKDRFYNTTQNIGWCEDGEKDWSQGIPVATRSWKRRGTDSPLEPLGGMWPGWHFDISLMILWTSVPQHHEKITFYVLKHLVCGNLLHQPQETNRDSDTSKYCKSLQNNIIYEDKNQSDVCFERAVWEVSGTVFQKRHWSGRSFLTEAAACKKAWRHRAWCVQETETYGFSLSVRGRRMVEIGGRELNCGHTVKG